MATASPDNVLVYQVAAYWLRVAEPPPQKDPLSEAELSLIWQGQRFPPEALTTVDGRVVEVVYPGRRGGGVGPDFRDAVVRLDGVERRGDIELHVRSGAFRAHGHDADPAYANLALHVVYRAEERETRLANGATAPVAAFAPWLERRSRELESWLRAPEIWREPCRGATQRLGEPAVREALEAAGLGRFEARAEAMARQIGLLGPEEALWRALLETLGAGGDREGFRRLAAAFPASLAVRVGGLEAALVHVSGLGVAPDVGVALPVPLAPPLQSYGRPANRPQRRLAGLAALVRRAVGQPGNRAAGQSAGNGGQSSAGSGGFLDLPAGFGGDGSGAGNRVKPGGGLLSEMALASLREAAGAKGLLAAWQAPPGIGAGRAQELLVNAVLPFAAAQGWAAKAGELLRGLPAAPVYGKTAFLEANLHPARGRIARNALQSQGMLAYVSEWCSQGGCGRCPLSPGAEVRG